ncbi:MAG: hypothetical protein ACFCUQ_15385 [Kiloniellales bacterium]
MSLLDIWRNDPSQLDPYRVRQIVSFAGNGVLSDGNFTSNEFREFLSYVDSQKLFVYVRNCLGEKFERSGFVLQDLVNELGRRLDYKVINGRYRGSVQSIGHDGLWEAPSGWKLVIEVKTTDTYRVDLEVLARYRMQLREQGQLDDRSSILIVVGRQETGDLEAQIRGSRHAWDIRLLSADALVKLVSLKEEGDAATAERIRSLLLPNEYTRLDSLIEIVFDTAEDGREAGDAHCATKDSSGRVLTAGKARRQKLAERSPEQKLSDLRARVMQGYAASQKAGQFKKSKLQY